MKYNLVNIDISTKKGHKQSTLWSVFPNRPHPCLSSDYTGGPLRWVNHEGILDKYNDIQGNPPVLENTYICNLMRSDFDLDTAKGNRQDFAGFDEMKYGEVDGVRGKVSKPNPGTIELRGKDLREIRVEIGKYNQWTKGLDVKIQVRGFSTPSGTEGEFIRSQIVPELLRYIEENKAELRYQAISAVRERVQKEVAEKRAQLEKLSLLMEGALNCL